MVSSKHNTQPSRSQHPHPMHYARHRMPQTNVQYSSPFGSMHSDQRMTLDPMRSILLSSPPAINTSSSIHNSESRQSSRNSQRTQSRSCHDQQIQSPLSISQAPDIAYSPPSHFYLGRRPSSQSSHHHLRQSFALDEDSEAAERRKAFVIGITKPSAKRGFIICRLCNAQIWGPNGRYHIEKCPIITNARQTAKKSGTILRTINGIPVDDAVFKRPKRAQPKAAKITGFVMSSSVALANPAFAPSSNQIEAGVKVGRKGYVRCLSCNSEIFAPNARYHASICHRSQLLPR